MRDGDRQQGFRIDLEGDGGAGELISLLPTRVQFPDPPHDPIIDLDPGRSLGMQGWMGCLHEARLPRCKQGLQIALDVEEIDRPLRYAPLLFEPRPVRDGAESDRLPHPGDLELALAHIRVPQEYSADLERAHPRELPVEIGPDVRHQAADQG